MDKFIQVFSWKSNSLYRFICKVFTRKSNSMNKSTQVFTWKSNSLSQWINLYKFPREGLILCINLCKSSHEKTNSMNKSIQVSTRRTNSLYKFICKCLRERLSCVSMDKSIQVFTRKSNSVSQWINLYKCSRERVIPRLNG